MQFNGNENENVEYDDEDSSDTSVHGGAIESANSSQASIDIENRPILGKSLHQPEELKASNTGTMVSEQSRKSMLSHSEY